MAIFHRSKEKWDPKKPLSKCSKNRTYEIKRTTAGASNNPCFDLKNALWMEFGYEESLEWNTIGGDEAIPTQYDKHVDRYRDVNYTKALAAWTPTGIDIPVSRWCKAVDFETTTGSATQGDHKYLRNDNRYVQFSPSQLFGGPNTGGDGESQAGSRNIFFSFWIYLHTQNADNDGHTFAHWGQGGESDWSQPYSMDPFLSFFITGSGSVAIRFVEAHADTDDLAGTPAPGADYLHFDGTPSFLQVASTGDEISVGNWHHVVVGLKFASGFAPGDVTSNTRIWVDGTEVSGTAATSVQPSDFNNPDVIPDAVDWEWQFGSLVNGYGSYRLDGSDHVIKRSSGFSGALGKFVITTQDCTDELERNEFAKFLYEANREGVYGIHSGAHNPIPATGKLNQWTTDSSQTGISFERFARPYPPNGGGFDQHTMTTASGSMFKEGASSVDTFDKTPSMFWLQPLTGSSISDPNIEKNVKIIPQLRTALGDPIVATWLSSARSKFFAEDLDTDDGFFITPVTTLPKDQSLYPTTLSSQTVGPFNDITTKKSKVVGEYEKCFTIDIPISNGNTACTLTTDGGSEQSLIEGTADTVAYTVKFYGGYTGYENAGYTFGNIAGYVRKDGLIPGIYPGGNGSATLDTHYYGGGWLPVTMGGSARSRADVLGFTSGAGNSTTLTLDLDYNELNAWLKTLSVMKHALHQQLEIPLKENAGDIFWDDRVYGNEGISSGWNSAKIIEPYANNPLWANIIWTILQIPAANWTLNSQSIPVAHVQQPALVIAKENEMWIAIAIYLLRNYDSGYDLAGLGTLVAGGKGATESQPPHSQYWRVGAPYTYQTDIDPSYNSTNLKYIGWFYMMPTALTPNNATYGYKYQESDTHTPTQNGYDNVTGRSLTTLRDLYKTSAYWGASTKATRYLTEGSADYYTMSNVTPGSPVMAVNNPQIRMKTMAYHNFSTGNWETLSGGKGDANGFSPTNVSIPDPLYLMDDATVGFTPMTSLLYPYDTEKLEEVIDSAGRPTDAFGFPFHDKYKSGANQSFDLSDYIREPVILKGWELKMDVIPNTGTSSATGISYLGSYNPEVLQIGEANMLYGGSLPSPYVWYESSNRRHATSYPRATDGLARTALNAKGQVTKGVTAFLLKESNTQEKAKLIDAFSRTSHEWSYYSNCVHTGSVNLKTKSPEITREGSIDPASGSQIDLEPGVASSTKLSGGPQASAYFDSSTSRELLGYLQHVYHNDAKFETTETFQPRTNQLNDGDLGSVSQLPVNFKNLFNRENYTYIEEIGTNTTTTKMFVSGSVKLNSKVSNQSVVSPFFVRTGAGKSGNMSGDHFGLDMDLSSQAESQVFAANYSIFNSWDGGFGTGELVDGMTVSSVVGEKLGDTITLPKFCLPLSETASTSHTPKISPLQTPSSLDPASETDLILYPNDKLILGIQDSISTIMGSQIIDYSGKLWKVGRQKLEIPAEQKSSYIRLYLERRRENKPIVVRSNQSHGFSGDVNEDLGDTMNIDQYDVAPTRVYSGSFSDDIMADHPLTGSFSELRVSYNQFNSASDGTAFSGSSQVIPDLNTHATVDPFKIITWNTGTTIKVTMTKDGKRGSLGNTVAIDFTDEDPSSAGVASYSSSGSGTLSIKYDAGSTDADAIAAKINAVSDFTAVVTGTGSDTANNTTIGADTTFGGGAFHANNPSIGHTGTYPDLKYPWIYLNARIWKDRKPGPHSSEHGNNSCFYSKKPNFQVTPIVASQTTFWNGVVTAENGSGIDQNNNLEQLSAMGVGMWPVAGDHAAGGSNKINPIPSFAGQDTAVRLGMASALWELNRSTARHAPTTNQNKQTVMDNGQSFEWGTGLGTDIPAFSPWTFKAVIPFFPAASAGLKFHYILFTVRLIAIDQDCKPQAYNPLTTSWENLDPGDIFYFDKTAKDDVRGSHAIKISKWDGSTPTGHSHTGVNWSSHVHGSAPLYFADLFCVAASGKVYGTGTLLNHFDSHGEDAVGCWENHSGGSKLSWDAMMNGIKKVLETEASNVTGLNYTIGTDYPTEDWFQIQYLDDDFVNDSFLSSVAQGTSVTLEETFNSLTQFSLMGTTGVGGDLPDETIWAYRSRGDGGYSATYQGNFGHANYRKEDAAGTVTTLNPASGYDTDPAMTNEYLRVANQGTQNVGTGSNYENAYTQEQMTVDYSFLPQKEGVKMNVGAKKYTPKINQKDCKIDRKITYRTSEGTAGPFGSLNKFQTLVQSSGNNTYYDSRPRAIFGFEPMRGVLPETVTDYTLIENNATVGNFFVNASKEIPPGWLMMHYKDSVSEGTKALSVQVECSVASNVATPTLPVMPGSPGKTTRDDAVYSNKDTAGNTVSFSSLNADGVADYIELVDHILETFPIGTKDKIFGDIAGGFGDGPQGRLVYRPSKYKHSGFNLLSPSGLTTHFMMKLDPVRGARFGLLNTNELKKRYVFSNRSFGQQADMFEQPLDSRFSSDIDDPFDGAVIKFRSRNPNNPSSDMPVDQNTRRNVDLYQRATYPFFDATGIPDEDYPNGEIPNNTLSASYNGPDWSGITINPDTGTTTTGDGEIIPSPNPPPNTTVNVTGTLQSSRVIRPGQMRNTLKKP